MDIISRRMLWSKITIATIFLLMKCYLYKLSIQISVYLTLLITYLSLLHITYLTLSIELYFPLFHAKQLSALTEIGFPSVSATIFEEVSRKSAGILSAGTLVFTVSTGILRSRRQWLSGQSVGR